MEAELKTFYGHEPGKLAHESYYHYHLVWKEISLVSVALKDVTKESAKSFKRPGLL